MNSPIEGLQPLSSAQYERARQNAADRLRASVPQPDRAHYEARQFSRYPLFVTRGLIGVLIVVAVSSFWVSAGKEIAASSLVLQPIVQDYGMLSQAWATLSIIAMLLLGELGTILFFAAAGIFARPGARMIKVIFWIGAALCAFFAVLANMTISVIHTPGMMHDGVTLFGWFMTLAPPLIVVFVGVFLERLLFTLLEARALAADAYNKDYDTFQSAQRSPETHPRFQSLLYHSIFEALKSAKTSNRGLIERAVEETPGIQGALVMWQISTHEWANQPLGEVQARPIQPPAVGELQRSELPPNPLALSVSN